MNTATHACARQAVPGTHCLKALEVTNHRMRQHMHVELEIGDRLYLIDAAGFRSERSRAELEAEGWEVRQALPTAGFTWGEDRAGGVQ